MGYIDEHLLSGERVRYRTTQHWAMLIAPGLFCLLGLLAFKLWWLLLIGIVWFGAQWLVRSSSEFAVTNKRVIIKVGLVRRRSVETLLTKVEGIGVDQGIFGRMFG